MKDEGGRMKKLISHSSFIPQPSSLIVACFTWNARNDSYA